MLLYSNLSFCRLALHVSGSVLWQKYTFIVVLSLTALNVAVQFLMVYGPENLQPSIPNNYAVATLGMVVAFASVFRTNLAWQRYWESLSQVHYMYSKCTDAFSAYSAFTKVTVERARKTDDEARASRVEREYERVHNYFSWMSALAVDRINHGCTNRMDQRRLVSSWQHQIITLQELRRGEDQTGATKLPAFHVGSADDQKIAKTWKHSFVVSALPSELELQALDQSEDRVQVIVTWIIGSLSHLSEDLAIPPPIQSRIYQEISNAMVGFENCVKIADVPFPFPYAQVLGILVLAFALITPVSVACFTRSFILGPVFTLLLSASIWCVNEVAKQLENPFGMDDNDISLEDLHGSFIGVLKETGAVLDVQSIVRNGSVPKVEVDTMKENTSSTLDQIEVERDTLMETTDPNLLLSDMSRDTILVPELDGQDTPKAVEPLRANWRMPPETSPKPTMPQPMISAEPSWYRPPKISANPLKTSLSGSIKDADVDQSVDNLHGTAGAVARYLPKRINGKQVLIHEGGQFFRADNHELNAPAAGLRYRRSKRLQDSDSSPSAVCLWGSTVEATDHGDDWVQVKALWLPQGNACEDEERLRGCRQQVSV